MKLPARRSTLTACAVVLLVAMASRAAPAPEKPGVTVDWSKVKGAPDKTDARYTADALRQAFAALCKSVGYRALTVEVDQSESPFLVYGVLEGRCDYRKLRDKLSTMDDYTYVGSVTNVHRDGAATAFALNMIPESARARNRENAQRTMERMKQLANSQR
jgi:hypothetical protein